MTMNNHTNAHIVIFGGNGFVGTNIAQRLVEKEVPTTCVSRTGTRPVHLENQPWADKIHWIGGDATDPDMELVQSATTVVTLVGSPPIPTLGRKAYNHQVHMNSEANIRVIDTAERTGVKRVVVMGAHIPFPIRTDKFGYSKGKRLSFEAAQAFADISPEHSAVVLQPSAIIGTRYNPKGKAIPLDAFMGPVIRFQRFWPGWMQRLLPESMVKVEEVARMAVHASLSSTPYEGCFTVISNRQIIEGLDQ
jgi:nucleoside-diphosphate-sugar epimerase